MRRASATLRITISWWLVVTAAAQDQSAATRHNEALRQVRLLELPQQRNAATARILAMGRHATSAINATLTDPRPEVICRLALIIRALGNEAEGTAIILKKVAASENPKLAYAARWALSTFEPTGITLLSDRTNDRILEVDRTGKEVWHLGGLAGVFDARRLPSGNYLVALSEAGAVQELTRHGKVVWSHETKQQPQSATRLPNGNTLIATPEGNITVAEVTAKGTTVWQYGPGWAWSAQRLTDGTTLVPSAMKKEIRLIDHRGKTLRTYPCPLGVIGLKATERNTFLICPHGRRLIQEMDHSGRVLADYGIDGKPHSAHRVPTGGIAVAGEDFAALYDANGKANWVLKAGCYGSAMHY